MPSPTDAPRPVDLDQVDVWSLRCFVTTAEELSFGGAALELHISQPALSRRIRKLEQNLGVTLFQRTTRQVTLTPAGSALLPVARDITTSLERGLQRAHAAAQPTVTIGFTAGLTTNAVVRAFRASWPDVEVLRRSVDWDRQALAVASDEVDVCIGRHPVAGDDLEVLPLFEEARVVVMARDHRLAKRASLLVDDLGGEPMVQHQDMPTWDAFWRIDPRPDGRPAPRGPRVTSVEEKLELVASGEALAILPASALALYTRPEIASVPLIDAAPSVAVVITKSARTPVVQGLLDATVGALANAAQLGPS